MHFQSSIHQYALLCLNLHVHAGNEKFNPVWISDIRNLIFIKYSSAEVEAFFYFHALTTDSRQFLPRGWKVLLNYHGLVRNILCLNNEAINVNGWMLQLISWIFMCWEWEENMNIIIEKWKESGDLKSSQSNAPSLLMIVDHFIEDFGRENTKVTVTSNEEAESSRKEPKKMNENVEGKIVNLTNGENDIPRSGDNIEDMERASSQKLPEDLRNKLDVLEKSLAELKKDIQEFKKQVPDDLKNDIEEIKEKIVKMHNGKNGKNEKNMEKKSYNFENWMRMRSALQKYDVTMDGIQAFQRFRFNCISGHLPRY